MMRNSGLTPALHIGPLLAKLGGSFGAPGIKPGSDAFKASSLPVILSLAPYLLF